MFSQIPEAARYAREPITDARAEAIIPSKASRKISRMMPPPIISTVVPSYPPMTLVPVISLHLFISSSSRQRYDLDLFNLESSWPCDLLISAKLLAWRATGS
jgi:hypothetical protein